MENKEHIYSHQTLNKIISKYNEIRPLLQKYGAPINEGDYITNLERCLLIEGSEPISWDYLDSPHRIVQEKINSKNTLRCIKLYLRSGKSILFSLAGQADAMKFHVTSLDIYYGKLCQNYLDLQKFNDLFLEINTIENKHFNSHSYKDKISQLTNEQLLELLNIPGDIN